jgi:protein-L-isoaspartate(D-aspartate) O-methyltransferase
LDGGMTNFAQERARMVARQIAARGVSTASVLEAMRRVPREKFVAEGFQEFAYEDSALPIAEGQTISQPYIVALMIESAEVEPGDKVLEIGTGTGYGAAVLGRIAHQVYTIERHARLADVARRLYAELGYRNIEVRCGDGTSGWPEAAPFDAIIVWAGGPVIPEPLTRQLAIGGRLVLPVGAARRDQRLARLTRHGEEEFEEEDIGPVAFVPLIGAYGWQDAQALAPSAIPNLQKGGRQIAPPARPKVLHDLIADAAEPLLGFEEPDFAEPFDRFTDAKIAALGEATHGTSEFYRARAAITRRLIERHGFTIVAVEADWPDAAAIDRYVRHRPPLERRESAFTRFPRWMWRNQEVHDFIEWMRGHNASIRDPVRQAGFFGLDLYNLNASIRAVLDYLDSVDPQAARIARERYGCLTPWQHEPATYGRAALSAGYAMCEEPVVSTLRELLDKELDYSRQDGEAYLDAMQNARLVASAEQYYRAMYYGSAESWNLRDRHMFGTLQHLLASRGEGAKAVIWAHNSHIGDASATDMGVVRGELNLGQLCRENFGDGAALIGFGTDHGTVAAASDWDGPMEIKTVRPAHRDSYEHLWHESGSARSLCDLREGHNQDLRWELLQPRLERAIGVIYLPETELLSHYFDASLPQQFDAYVWFDRTEAVKPLPGRRQEGVPETYPFGL